MKIIVGFVVLLVMFTTNAFAEKTYVHLPWSDSNALLKASNDLYVQYIVSPEEFGSYEYYEVLGDRNNRGMRFVVGKIKVKQADGVVLAKNDKGKVKIIKMFGSDRAAFKAALYEAADYIINGGAITNY